MPRSVAYEPLYFGIALVTYYSMHAHTSLIVLFFFASRYRCAHRDRLPKKEPKKAARSRLRPACGETAMFIGCA